MLIETKCDDTVELNIIHATKILEFIDIIPIEWRSKSILNHRSPPK